MRYKIITLSGRYKKNLFIDAPCDEVAVMACKAIGENFACEDENGHLVAKSADTVYNSLCMTRERAELYRKTHYRDIVDCFLSCRVNGYRRDTDKFRAYSMRIASVFKYVYGGD